MAPHLIAWASAVAAVDPWSSDFTAFDDLLDGSATLRAVQSSEFNIRLGRSQLVIKTVPAPAATSLLMTAASVVGFYRFRRPRRVSRGASVLGRPID